jgi:hypothetical protein
VGGNFQEKWAVETWAVSYRAVGGNFYHLVFVPSTVLIFFVEDETSCEDLQKHKINNMASKLKSQSCSLHKSLSGRFGISKGSTKHPMTDEGKQACGSIRLRSP